MKTDALERFLGKFHGKRLLLDANLLLLYFKGCFYKANLQAPRHGTFVEEEFVLLAQTIEHFNKAGRVLTTPHLLTELSNISEDMKLNHFHFLRSIRILIGDLDEWFDKPRIGAYRLSGQNHFATFGLADAVIIELAHDPLLILTNDKQMARYLQDKKRKRNVCYFGDLKERCLYSN
jgi:hypothetical protein